MTRPNHGGWKTCSRGHKFRGEGACLVCWPGRVARSAKQNAKPSKK